MASLESKFFYRLLRLINKKKFLELQFVFEKFDFYNCKEPPRETSKICNISKHQVNGRNVFTLSPKNVTPVKHILYLHGGAYVQGFVKLHWKFLSMLVQQTRCTITAPDYPLAPKNTYVDSFAMVTMIYSEIINRAGAKNMILMGDSAGGGFALALAKKMREEDVQQPDKIILLCPWLDITLTNPEIQKIDPLDPFLSVPALKRAGLAYAGNADPLNFAVSPIHGSMKNLGEIFLFMGSLDVLAADARKLKTLAELEGVHIHYREYPDMVHMWLFLNFEESRMAQREILDCLL
jgi:acetyl esterase/lipase